MANSQGGKIKRPVGFVRNGSLFRQMASVAAKRWVGLLLAFYAVATDRLTGWNGMGFAMRGLLDEPAHLATAIVILGALIRIRRAIPDHRFGWTMLTCSVLIDIDHLPAEFGSDVLTSGTPRPYTHALWTVIVLTLAWAIAQFFVMRSGRPHPATIELLLAGAASGVAAHFVRDITTAPMSFWWPISDIAVQVPYWWYVLALAIIMAIGPVEKHLRLTYATFDAPTLNTHVSRAMCELVAARDWLTVFRLPPYASELNPVKMLLPQCEFQRSS